MEILLFILIILLASILQTSTGFGFSILATPFLLLLFEPKEAIQINLILSLIISAALFSKIKKDTDIGVLKRFAVGSAAGLPIGIGIFLFLDISRLKLAVSFIILLLTLLLMANVRVKETSRRDYSVGGLSGIMTTSIGMPGPPLLLYFQERILKKSGLGELLWLFTCLSTQPVWCFRSSLQGQIRRFGFQACMLCRWCCWVYIWDKFYLLKSISVFLRFLHILY